MKFYLDHNATTPIHPEVVKAMTPYLEGCFGNPSSIHSFGREARATVDRAREDIASLLGAKAKELVFTSGGTEANNLAIFGIARALRHKGRHIITCATEHHSVLHPCEHLKKEGFEVQVLPVNKEGLLDLDVLEKAFRPDTILVSIMSANNETGILHPIPEIGKLCQNHGVPFHCDAIQSFGKLPIHVDQWGVNLLSIAAHKFYGPKGAGVLYVRTGTRPEPIQWGGAHENERRAGTENVATIVGMAAAASLALKKSHGENQRLFDLVEKLWNHLSTTISGIRRNGHSIQRLGNTLNVSFEGCDGEGLLVGLDLEGIAASSGSACMVGSVLPSHVLRAMGLEDKLIRATVRFSLGTSSTEQDLPVISDRVKRVVERLRKF